MSRGVVGKKLTADPRGTAQQKDSLLEAVGNQLGMFDSLTVSTRPGLPGGKHAGQVSLAYLWTSGCPSDSRPLGALVAAACEALAGR